MDSFEEFSSEMTVITIVSLVATFLLNTGRALGCFKLSKECLVLLDRGILGKGNVYVKTSYRMIYELMFSSYCQIRDYRDPDIIEYGHKLLAFLRESGEKAYEGEVTFCLAQLNLEQSRYEEAIELYEKAASVMMDIGEREKEGVCHKCLGILFDSLNERDKAEKCLRKALMVAEEVCNKKEEAVCCRLLGHLFHDGGKHGMAEEYVQRSLVICKEGGDIRGEIADYVTLGSVYCHIGEYAKAEKYLVTAIAVSEKIGYREAEGTAYGNLGKVVIWSRGDYLKAKEYYEKALTICKETGEREKEGTQYGNLGNLFFNVGEYDKAEEYYENALAIRIETQDRKGEATDHGNLGNVFLRLGKFAKAKKYFEKAIWLSKKLGFREVELVNHLHLASLLLIEGDVDRARPHLFATAQKLEDMRSFLSENDQFKISLTDKYASSYQFLSALYCKKGEPNEALSIVELGRARALSDLMARQYSVEKESINQFTYMDGDWSMQNERNVTCLYISYYEQYLFLWIRKANKPMRFRQIDINDCFMERGPQIGVHDLFAKEETFRKLYFLPLDEQCEDRSWFSFDDDDLTPKSSLEHISPAFRLMNEEENQQRDPTLADVYRMIIAPVADLLDDGEIIIVPDRVLFKVPFSALVDENEKYLSETFRIRIVPSLTTLKLIQDCPVDYHSQTGVLVVGDPVVGEVCYNGKVYTPRRLPFAREEAEMIGRLLGAHTLLGEEAMKEAVLQRISSVSLIHFAAHGNDERGEIVLAPPPSMSRTPQEEDYLLTMADISQVRLRAKLVVLSCCHSARGQIRAEGVVGIARAFLGSGARSVLVALWAIQDKATKQFMSHFYEHLVRGESASESLHQAMRWMRENGFSEVRQWAPFMLIGDNVSFDFRKKRYALENDT